MLNFPASLSRWLFTQLGDNNALLSDSKSLRSRYRHISLLVLILIYLFTDVLPASRSRVFSDIDSLCFTEHSKNWLIAFSLKNLTCVISFLFWILDTLVLSNGFPANGEIVGLGMISVVTSNHTEVVDSQRSYFAGHDIIPFLILLKASSFILLQITLGFINDLADLLDSLQSLFFIKFLQMLKSVLVQMFNQLNCFCPVTPKLLNLGIESLKILVLNQYSSDIKQSPDSEM